MPKLFVDDGEVSILVDLEVGESLELGRSAAADIPLASERASRRHCRIEARGAGHVVVDLGSSNGTSVGGVRLDSEHVLVDGDAIDAGGARIVYRRGERA